MRLEEARAKAMFQSTHPRGVRLADDTVRALIAEFQSTHPRGVRHALRKSQGFQGRCFNPRTRVGCDLPDATASEPDEKFQSTHPRGVRRARVRCAGWPRACFNPRTRVGCDGAGLGYIPQDEVFQSTHPRGVRLRGVVRIPQDIDVSIHAPAWGATCGGGVVAPTAGVSIHAPAWGATRRNSRNTRPCAGFNPRTRVGCDLSKQPESRMARLFQSTHPRGVRLFPCFIQ